MSQASDQDYLHHIVEAIERIERSTTEGKEAFLADADAYDASLRRLHTIAESTQRLSEELKARHVEIPWSQMAGFRNRIVHAYMDLDPDLVWRIIEENLPALQQVIVAELDR